VVEYDAFADALVAGAKTYIDSQFAPILQRLAVLEARTASEPVPGVGIQSAIRNAAGDLVFILTDGKMLPIGPIDGKDGKDAAPVDPGDIARMIDETVARLPPAAPGKDAPAVPVEAVAAALKAEIEPVLRDVALAAVAALPKAVDGADADMVEVQRLIGAEVTRQIAEMPPVDIEPIVARAVAAMPPGPAGRDADPEVIAAQVERAVAALPRPADGKSVSAEDIAPVVERAVAQAVAALPPAPAGKDADPEVITAEVERAVAALPRPADGRTPTEADIEPIVAAAVAALPPAPAGRDADPEVTAKLIEAQVAAMPRPADGKSVSVEDLAPVIERAVAQAVAARPPAKDGVGVTGALIDREGRLVLTLSDGAVKELGVVLGKDADMEALAAICVREIEKIPRPRDGIDGLGFEDVQVVHDGERQVTIRFARGEHVKEFALTIPAIIDRGIWREGKFAKGDGVTWDGSFFIAQCDTEQKPLLHQDWRQAVKAGRPGKNTETVKYLPASVKLADNAAP
jgi:hypothetical protein